MSTFEKFEDIEVWQKARVLSNEIFKLSKDNSFSEDRRLRDQMNGSSGSIADNIAEGFGRGGNKEFAQYLWISKGSIAELKSRLYRCKDRDWILIDKFNDLYGKMEVIDKMVQGLLNFLSKSNIKGIKYKNR